jgi:hypothetical protein
VRRGEVGRRRAARRRALPALGLQQPGRRAGTQQPLQPRRPAAPPGAPALSARAGLPCPPPPRSLEAARLKAEELQARLKELQHAKGDRAALEGLEVKLAASRHAARQAVEAQRAAEARAAEAETRLAAAYARLEALAPVEEEQGGREKGGGGGRKGGQGQKGNKR